MALYVTTPYHRMMNHRRMFNRMMNDEWSGDTARVAFPLDVKDSNEAYEITAVLPGVSADDLNIQIANDTLTIQGELKVESDEQATYLLRERTAGRFMRSLQLPEAVDSGKVEASLKDGILTLRVPKAEQARPKSIKVNVN